MKHGRQLSCAGKGGRTAAGGCLAEEAIVQFAAERQAGNIPTAQRGHRRAAGTADAYSSATVRPAKAQALPALSDKMHISPIDFSTLIR